MPGKKQRKQETPMPERMPKEPLAEPLHSMEEEAELAAPLMEEELPEGTTGVSIGPEMPIGALGKIGQEQVREAAVTLKKYKDGKANLESRIIQNEQWWKMRHWDLIKGKDDAGKSRPEPASAWLFNSVSNKHADAMDNYPEPSVLPRAQDDEQAAKQLSAILPVVLEQNQYEQVYSDAWWYKLKTGTGVKGVFWDQRKANGLGDIDVRKVDILNLFWEPGITDIQKSRNLFHVELIDNDLLMQQYPFLHLDASQPSVQVNKYVYDDTVDTSGKSAVIDWYYKLYDGARDVLHYCKFVNDIVLYASENDPDYAERGFYDHGKYPFVFDTLFEEEGTPCGFGYIDVMKDTQMYIDKMGQVVIENALQAARKRYFIRADGGVNEAEYADLRNDFVHTTGNLGEDSIKEITVSPLPSICVEILNNKIDELKETSGNRDFSQGGTASGVTAASAIAALQEAGSKLSRDMIKSAYRAFTQECYLVLELMRQFYDEPRTFRITGEGGEQQFETFDNAAIQPQEQGQDFGVDLGERVPVFDIKVAAQKKSPFSKISQNELAKELYGAGMFNPEIADQALICLDMMDFEGKDKVVQKVAQNQTLLQTVQQLQAQMLQMAQIIDAQNGTTITQGMAEEQMSMQGQPMPGSAVGGGQVQTNALGGELPESGVTNQARQRTAQAANPQ